MSKTLKERLFTMNNVLFLITTAIMLTILIAPLIHQMDVEKYALDTYSGLTTIQIQSEFSRLVNYLWLWHRSPLELMYFPMSSTGVIHFEEVKVFVDGIQVLFVLTGIVFVLGVKKRWMNREIAFLKSTAHTTFIILGTLLAFGLVAFDRLFVLFHQIVFRNNYWIFSERTDPVIKILPEEFFMHGFFAIIAFVLLFAGIMLWLYKKLTQPKDL